MTTLNSTDDLAFEVSDTFDIKYLEPVAKYVLWKLQHEWDDYNELTHAARFFHQAEANTEVWIDSHIAKKGEDIAGVAFVIGGKIGSLETRYETDDPERSLILKYFHIVDKGNGTGRHWLRNIIFPYYQKLGFGHIYLSSSHPKSFSLYSGLGVEIADYTSKSDNGIFERKGKCFRMDLAG